MASIALPSQRMDGAAWLMLVALATLWGSSFVLVEVLLEAFPPLTLVALRVALAALTLWSAAALLGALPPLSAPVWRAFAVMGVFNNVVPFGLIVWGQITITAGSAAILNATTPLFTAILAGLLLSDERLTAAKITGLLAGLAGVAVMVGPTAFSDAAGTVWGKVAILVAALSYAGSAVFARRFKTMGLRPVAIAAGQTTMSTLVLLPAVLIVDQPWSLPMPSVSIWAVVILNAVFATALAYILYFSIIARAGATNAALVTVLVPVVAVIAGALFLGETVSNAQLAGMALIMVGLAIVDGRLAERLR